MKPWALLTVCAMLCFLSSAAHAGTEMVSGNEYETRPWQPPPPPHEGEDWTPAPPPPPVAYYPPPVYYYPPYPPPPYAYGPGFYGPAIGIGFRIR